MGISAPAEHYGAVLRAERNRRRWTQAQLAERSGLSENTISRFETASREPRIGQLVALACVLDVDATKFLPESARGKTA